MIVNVNLIDKILILSQSFEKKSNVKIMYFMIKVKKNKTISAQTLKL